MSAGGGFDCVPVTVFIDGPLGPGSLQVWVDEDATETDALVDLVPSREVPNGLVPLRRGAGRRRRSVSVIHADDPALRRLAVFDVLVNNADRKGGHILASEGHVFGVDHGVSSTSTTSCAPCCGAGPGPSSPTTSCAAVRRARDEAPDRLVGLLGRRRSRRC